MIVAIVVGVDGSGKTPLIRLMQAANRDIMVKQVVTRPDDRRALARAEQEVVTWARDSGVVVYDRFPYPDDFVYDGQLKRSDFPYWEQRIRDTGAIVKVVYCEPRNLTLYQQRMKREPDEFFDMSDMNVLLEHVGRYKLWLLQTQLPILRMNCDRFFDAEDAQRVLDWLGIGA